MKNAIGILVAAVLLIIEVVTEEHYFGFVSIFIMLTIVISLLADIRDKK